MLGKIKTNGLRVQMLRFADDVLAYSGDQRKIRRRSNKSK